MATAHDKLVGPVPARIIDAARPIVTPRDGRVADFNVAAWLQLPGLSDLPVSLTLSYRDGDRRREVPVDHGRLNGHGKILLSGIARLPVRLRLEDVQVRLKSAVQVYSLIVEELFVQAVEQVEGDSRHALA